MFRHAGFLPCAGVVRMLEELRASRGLPEQIMTDNGPEFIGRVMDAWSCSRLTSFRS